MDTRTTVGVIIPTHRFDAWLDEAVTSTLASKDVDFQLVVVANGIAEVAHRPWIDDERVTLLHFPEPLGSGGAMLPGLGELTTDFVARLDADDRMLPARLHTQATYLIEHPDTHLVCTTVRRITESGADAGAVRIPTGRDVRRKLVFWNPLVHSSYMMRRESLIRVGGYDPRHKQMDDYDLALRLSQLGAVAVLPEELVEYRLHSDQISRGAKPRGEHIDRVITLRKKLGKSLGMNWFSIWVRTLIWRGVQFTRYYRLTKPGHEY